MSCVCWPSTQHARSSWVQRSEQLLDTGQAPATFRMHFPEYLSIPNSRNFLETPTRTTQIEGVHTAIGWQRIYGAREGFVRYATSMSDCPMNGKIGYAYGIQIQYWSAPISSRGRSRSRGSIGQSCRQISIKTQGIQEA